MTTDTRLPTAAGIAIYCAYDEVVDTISLIPNPRNPNRHPEAQIRLLAQIIGAQGWRAPITVSNRSGFVVRGHPTMKPLALIERSIANATEPGQLVVDPFLGSGTAVIAAERTGRLCYGMDLEPRYCDVILARWEAETGERALRLSSCQTGRT